MDPLSLSHDTSLQFAILANGCWDEDEHRNAQGLLMPVDTKEVLMSVHQNIQLNRGLRGKYKY